MRTCDATISPLVEPVKKYLIEGNKYILVFCDDVVASIELPASMIMTIAESSEGVRGDSANNMYKPATMETGLVVQVPLFINPGIFEISRLLRHRYQMVVYENCYDGYPHGDRLRVDVSQLELALQALD